MAKGGWHETYVYASAPMLQDLWYVDVVRTDITRLVVESSSITAGRENGYTALALAAT